jgi:hypothetical protein
MQLFHDADLGAAGFDALADLHPACQLPFSSLQCTTFVLFQVIQVRDRKRKRSHFRSLPGQSCRATVVAQKFGVRTSLEPRCDTGRTLLTDVTPPSSPSTTHAPHLQASYPSCGRALLREVSMIKVGTQITLITLFTR